MQKSENRIQPIYWGWDGIYDYSELRSYYKRFLEDQIGEEIEELALVGQLEESDGLNPSK